MFNTMRKYYADKKSKGKKGFTLIELLITVVVLGIIMGVAAPIYLNQKDKAEVAAAKSEVATIANLLVAGIGTGDLTLNGFDGNGVAGANASIVTDVGSHAVKAGVKIFRTGNDFFVYLVERGRN